ncbi:MAG: hypothetical protein KGJ62_09905 [Armatimonadetes bacterium]|nr:hypothetical protein [Armatimonadota bacterium]MDE2207959.1 hypothetical protein [Armatimonadota bacterium]
MNFGAGDGRTVMLGWRWSAPRAWQRFHKAFDALKMGSWFHRCIDPSGPHALRRSRLTVPLRRCLLLRIEPEAARMLDAPALVVP